MSKGVYDYSSKEQLEFEKQTLLNNFFHFGCHISEVGDNRKYIRLHLFDNDIIIYNDNGEIICFDNICPHRGAPFLCNGENEGCQKLECPYHGWVYENGRLVISNRNQFDNSELEDIDIFRYQVKQCGEFVFFAKTPLYSLREQLGDFYTTLETISHSITQKVDLNKSDFDSNWKISLENALENYHVPSVHPNTLAPLELSNGEVVFDKLNSIWISEIKNKKAFKKLSKIKNFFDPNIYYKENYFSIYLFPFSMISSTFGYSYAFQSFFPNSIERTSFYSRTYSVKSQLNTDAFYDSVKRVNRQIFDEDIAVCNSVQKALKGRAIPFVYNQQERRIVEFQKNYTQFCKA